MNLVLNVQWYGESRLKHHNARWPAPCTPHLFLLGNRTREWEKSLQESYVCVYIVITLYDFRREERWGNTDNERRILDMRLKSTVSGNDQIRRRLQTPTVAVVDLNRLPPRAWRAAENRNQPRVLRICSRFKWLARSSIFDILQNALLNRDVNNTQKDKEKKRTKVRKEKEDE